MARKKGGYQIVILATLTYAFALECVNCGKPLLIEDGVNEPYYADSIEVDEDENVVIRKGASSIVVAPNGTKTFNNVLNGALMENIVDANNNKRFVSGNISLKLSVEGLTKTYGKWCLSGNHFMIVLSLSILNTTSWDWTSEVATLDDIPQWILEKIFPAFGSYIERKTFDAFANDFSTQNLGGYLRKDSTHVWISTDGFTATSDKMARLEFDLLID